MGISDRKRSIDVSVNINLDLNQEIKPNQPIVVNNFKGGSFVGRKKSGNILAGSKLNVDGQGIYNVKIIKPDLNKIFLKQTPVSEGVPVTPSVTPTNTNTPTPTQTPINVGCSGIPYNLSDIYGISQSGNTIFVIDDLVTNNPDEITSGAIFFNGVDYNGDDQTSSYLSNLVGNYFTLTLCQNNVSAVFSGNPFTIEYFDIGPPYGTLFAAGGLSGLIQIVSANTIFNYNEIVYLDYTIIPGPTPTPTPTPTETPVPPPPFISIWRTTGATESITLPYEDGGTYSGTIDWGDGNTSVNSYVNRTHTYTSPNDYTVTIQGTTNGFSFAFGGDASKIIEILQWGNLNLRNSYSYFFGCDNLVLTGVTDTLNLVGTTNLSNIFFGCSSITTINNIDSWDVSNVTNMTYMFYATQFNSDISSWNVSNVTNMDQMFLSTPFNSDISNWDVSNVVNMNFMFTSTPFNQDISNWDVSNVAGMNNMFQSSQFNQDISNWNVSGVTNMSGMFSSSPFNQDISNWNVSNVTNMDQMFLSSQFNQPLSNWDVSSVISMSYMFYYSTVFNQDLSSWCVTGIPTTPANFDTGATSWVLPRPIWGTCP